MYEDYTHTMAFLLASRNRIINALGTINVSPAEREQCLSLCITLFDTYTKKGSSIIHQLNNAMVNRDIATSIQCANILNKHNRQGARLSRLFETDISDYQTDPDKFYPNGAETPIAAPPIDETALKTISKFISRLKTFQI